MSWTVVLPYYNELAYLPVTLKSLLAQHLKPTRIILVDNHSTDGSSDLARTLTANSGIDILHVNEPRPGKINALETGLARVETEFVAFCDADTFYPPHYLATADAVLRSGDDVVAAMAVGSQNAGPRVKARVVSTILRRQTHTGGFGQSFRTSALRQAGGYSAQRWPFVLEDHEIMQRLFKVGRAKHAYNLWCVPSNRRSDRANVNWTLPEQLLYHLVPFALKDWFFYSFLAARFTKRGLANTNLREKTWVTAPPRP